MQLVCDGGCYGLVQQLSDYVFLSGFSLYHLSILLSA